MILTIVLYSFITALTDKENRDFWHSTIVVGLIQAIIGLLIVFGMLWLLFFVQDRIFVALAAIIVWEIFHTGWSLLDHYWAEQDELLRQMEEDDRY